MTHTPTPWKVTSKSIWDIRIQTQDGADIAKCDNTGDWIKENNTLVGRSQNKLITDATFIVKACNAHDELVAALKGMIELMDSKPTSYDEDQQICSYRATLAKAEKGAQL